jgi:hypothetical protein
MGLHPRGPVFDRLSQTVWRTALGDAAAHARKTPVRDVAFQRLREGWEFEVSTWCARGRAASRYKDRISIRLGGGAVQAGVVQLTGRDGDTPDATALPSCAMRTIVLSSRLAT